MVFAHAQCDIDHTTASTGSCGCIKPSENRFMYAANEAFQNLRGQLSRGIGMLIYWFHLPLFLIQLWQHCTKITTNTVTHMYLLYHLPWAYQSKKCDCRSQQSHFGIDTVWKSVTFPLFFIQCMRTHLQQDDTLLLVHQLWQHQLKQWPA